MSYFHSAQGRGEKELVPGARTRTFWGDRILLSLVEIDANTEVPLHTHPHEQAGMVIEGEMEMGVAGEVQMLKPGICTSSPAGCPTTPNAATPPARPWTSSARCGKSSSTSQSELPTCGV